MIGVKQYKVETYNLGNGNAIPKIYKGNQVVSPEFLDSDTKNSVDRIVGRHKGKFNEDSRIPQLEEYIPIRRSN
jgi:hypothetical protein